MPKGPGSPLRPRKHPLTDEHIQASVAGGMNTENGHYRELVYGGIEDPGRALEIKRSLFRCAKYLGYSMTAQVERNPNGTYQVRFKAIDKVIARKYIAKKFPNGEGLPYNPYARNKTQETA
jgi:hypothetical protein